jgi:hypothetical protein
MFSKKFEFFLMRKITIKSIMDRLVRSKANSLGKISLENGPSLFIKEENKQQHTNNLIENGYSVLDFKLSPEMVNELVAYSEKIKCFDDYHDPTKPIDVKNEPKETHIAHYKREELVQFKPIMDIANDPSVLQIAQEFLGAKPTISNVNMWWSFGGKKQAEHAQLFHRDMDDWKFCKLFVYLTDVNEKSGPHIYVKGSSASPKLRKIRRYTDAEVENAFGKENVKTFTALKGTSFLVDTYGFHKGLLPESENRLLLQIQYSLFPIGIEEYKTVSIGTNNYNRYINRLLIS